ncbi:MAG TPA: DUF3618 domain-containing protein [Acetobacteraceae bacterium]|nr:DUF3618 domain-containing protein [Acetobacteraceae bacterium]
MSDHVNDPAQIERELTETRARLGSHLDELSRRLSPGQLLDEGLAYLRDGQGATFARNLGAQVRDNPLPVALTGIGIAWLALAGSVGGNRIPGSASRALVPYRDAGAGVHDARDDLADRAHRAGAAVTRATGETADAFSARVSDAQAKVLGLTRSAEETATAFADRVRQSLDRARQTAASWRDSAAEGMQRTGEAMNRARDNSARIGDRASQAGAAYASNAGSRLAAALSDNPLLLSAVGLTAGAVFGALLPETRLEERQLGPAATHVADAAQGLAEDVLQRGANVARAAAQAGIDAARREGAGLSGKPGDEPRRKGNGSGGDQAGAAM